MGFRLIYIIDNVQFQKTSILPPPSPEGDWNFLGVEGSVRPKSLVKCIKLKCNFQKSGGQGLMEKVLSMGEV